MEPTPRPIRTTAAASGQTPGTISRGLESIALPDGMYVCSPSPTRLDPPDAAVNAWSSRWVSSVLAVLGLLVLLSVVSTLA